MYSKAPAATNWALRWRMNQRKEWSPGKRWAVRCWYSSSFCRFAKGESGCWFIENS